MILTREEYAEKLKLEQKRLDELERLEQEAKERQEMEEEEYHRGLEEADRVRIEEDMQNSTEVVVNITDEQQEQQQVYEEENWDDE